MWGPVHVSEGPYMQMLLGGVRLDAPHLNIKSLGSAGIIAEPLLFLIPGFFKRIVVYL